MERIVLQSAAMTWSSKPACALLSLGLFLNCLPAQNPSVPEAHLPRLQDWFLSTGNQPTDPKLYVREFGSGTDTVVMLHGGWGGEHSGMIEAVKDLGSHYRFIFYDQRGSLRSSSPDALITFSQYIEDLELLRRELQLDKLNLVGHSMGAVLASAYAAKYPRQVQRLILVAPAYLKEPLPEADKLLQQQQQREFQDFLKRPQVQAELEKYRLNRSEPPLSSQEATSKARIQFAARMLADVTRWPAVTGGGPLYKGHVYELTARTYPKSGWNYLTEFQAAPYAVSIIVGDRDFLDFGNRLIKRWVQETPRVDLTIINDAGHLVWLDQPQRFTTQLRRHLAQTSRTATQ